MALTPKQRLFLHQAARLDPVGGLFAYESRSYMSTVTRLLELGCLTPWGREEHQQYRLTPTGLQAYLSQGAPKRRKGMRYLPHQRVESLIKALYPGKPTEVLVGPQGSYDIENALYLFFYGDRPLQQVHVSPLARTLGYDQEPERGEFGISTYRRKGGASGVMLSQKRMDDPSLVRYQSFPLLFACLPFEQGKTPDSTLIDGHHRLKRAYDMGIEVLYGYTLDSEETCLVQS